MGGFIGTELSHITIKYYILPLKISQYDLEKKWGRGMKDYHRRINLCFSAKHSIIKMLQTTKELRRIIWNHLKMIRIRIRSL